jgi:hypothetical protein
LIQINPEVCGSVSASGAHRQDEDRVLSNNVRTPRGFFLGAAEDA